jgi:hypothetical protein
MNKTTMDISSFQKFPAVNHTRRFSLGLEDAQALLLSLWRRCLKKTKSVILSKAKEDFS